MDDESDVPARTGEAQLTRPNWARAAIKAVPYIGDALEELAYGRLDEARWSRWEQTLQEIGTMMKERQIPPDEVKKEEYSQLLEIVAPVASRDTTEHKRRLLRDLLLNAVTISPGDAAWESARLVAQLIAELEVPSLVILSALASVGARGKAKAELRAIDDGKSAEIALTSPAGPSVALPYDWLVVEQAYRRVSSAPARLVIAGAHAVDKYEQLALTDLGEFLVNWATAAPIDPSEPTSARAV